jgi:hypothetical protein
MSLSIAFVSGGFSALGVVLMIAGIMNLRAPPCGPCRAGPGPPMSSLLADWPAL